MNSEPLSESIPRRRKGRAWRISSKAVWTRRFAAAEDRAVSTQVVWMSVTFSEWANSPSARWPACATRSSSVKPGLVTSQ